jgi:hypothetical protein
MERLLDALGPTQARLVLLSPLPMEPSAVRPDVKEANRNLELYAAEIGKIAEKRGAYFADLFAVVRDAKEKDPLTENGIHLTDDGYRRTAPHLLQALGVGLPEATRAPVEKLRATIVEKNRLYFHRWRPQNVTYLFGFRKHEQGKNAGEVPLFEPLVEAQEKDIAKLRVP